MTTIAWDGVSLVADTLSERSGLKGSTTKIVRLNDGSLFGYAGTRNIGLEIIEWLNSTQEKTDFPSAQKSRDDWGNGLLIKPDGSCWLFERSHIPLAQTDRTYTAIGSGRDYALATMFHGGNALEAVKCAAEFDLYTGGCFESLCLRED